MSDQNSDFREEERKKSIQRHNKRAIENHLTLALAFACKHLGIHWPDWDLDALLVKAIKSQLKSQSKEGAKYLDTFDAFYQTAQELKVDLDPKFELFFELNKH